MREAALVPCPTSALMCGFKGQVYAQCSLLTRHQHSIRCESSRVAPWRKQAEMDASDRT